MVGNSEFMKLTKNFSLSEFASKDGAEMPSDLMPNLQELAENLQVLRDKLNVTVKITGSGYRSPSHNKKVGGATKSQHLLAKAADINATGYTPLALYKEIENLISQGKMKEGGLGVYNSFVHYDIRGNKARWDKQK